VSNLVLAVLQDALGDPHKVADLLLLELDDPLTAGEHASGTGGSLANAEAFVHGHRRGSFSATE
jgi:hypothetical protein